MRNVNDAPRLVGRSNGTGAETATFTPFGAEANTIASGITIDDADKGAGVYRLELRLVGAGTGVSLVETSLKQDFEGAQSWEHWQWQMTTLSGAISAPSGILGYCPPLSGCSTGNLCRGPSSTGCTDGSGSYLAGSFRTRAHSLIACCCCCCLWSTPSPYGRYDDTLRVICIPRTCQRMLEVIYLAYACRALPCSAMLCYAMQCVAMLCYAMR